MKAYGISWEQRDEVLVGIYYDKYLCKTWKWGGIYQCVVDIRNTHKDTLGRSHVRISLDLQDTKWKAMKHAAEWVKKFAEEPRPTAEETIKESYERSPDLFTTRALVLDQLLLTNGCGYEWLEGGLIHVFQESCWVPEKELEEARKELRPAPDLGNPLNPYMCEHCLLACVPDDVTTDWLIICYEALNLLKYRADPKGSNYEENQKWEKKIRADLKKRFLDRIKREFPTVRENLNYQARMKRIFKW